MLSNSRGRLLIAAAIWGSLALLLWAGRTMLFGHAPEVEDLTLRNAELLALFAAEDRLQGAVPIGEAGSPPSAQGEAGRSEPMDRAASASGKPGSQAAPADAPSPGQSAQEQSGSGPDASAGGEKKAPAETGDSAARAGQPMIDINRATAAELERLPGIGPSKAKAIVEYREKHGPFRSVRELTNVKGIGDKTFEALKPLVVAGTAP
jgi:competence protein ComEA